MALKLVCLVVALATFMPGSQAARVKTSTETTSCPSAVEKNTKGDCIDASSGANAPGCCANLDACLAELKDQSPKMHVRVQAYMQKCEIQPSDLEGQIGGDKLCSEKCQSAAELRIPFVMDSAEMDRICQDGEAAEAWEGFQMTLKILSNLDTVWASCKDQPVRSTTVSTTVAEPSATTTHAEVPDKGDEDIVDDAPPETHIFLLDASAWMGIEVCYRGRHIFETCNPTLPRGTRYQYAVQEVQKKIETLSEKDSFYVAIFREQPYGPNDKGPMQATAENKAKAINLLLNSPTHSQSNLELALKWALSVPKVTAIHLSMTAPGTITGDALSGVVPFVKAPDPKHLLGCKQIQCMPIKLNEDYSPASGQTPVNTKLFMPSRVETSGKYRMRLLLKNIAAFTGGDYSEENSKDSGRRPGMVKLVGAGDPKVNGVWVETDLHYYTPQFTHMGDAKLKAEYSFSRYAWRIYKQNWFGHFRTTWYENYHQNEYTFPTRFWMSGSRKQPAPQVAEAQGLRWTMLDALQAFAAGSADEWI